MQNDDSMNKMFFSVLITVSILLSVFILLMILFFINETTYRIHEWNNHGNFLSITENLIAYIGGLVAIFSMYVLYRTLKMGVDQLNESSKSNKIASYIAIKNILQEENVREARNVVFKLFNGKEIKPLSEWNTNDLSSVQLALSRFDHVGSMFKYGYFDFKILESWYYTMFKTFYITEEYRLHIEKGCGKDYFVGINALIHTRNMIKEKNKSLEVFDFEQDGYDEANNIWNVLYNKAKANNKEKSLNDYSYSCLVWDFICKCIKKLKSESIIKK